MIYNYLYVQRLQYISKYNFVDWSFIRRCFCGILDKKRFFRNTYNFTKLLQ